MKRLTKTISLHEQIITYLQDQYPDYEFHPRDVFYNYHKGGLRLTYAGFSMLKEQEFDYERFQIDEGYVVNGKTLIKLHRNMIWPYYITKKNIFLFSDEDATMLKLIGNFASWIECLG